MATDFQNFGERLKYGFRDLTSVGQPSAAPSFLTNEQLYALNPERFNFYIQLTTALMTGDPSTVFRALGIENATRFQRQRMLELIENIGKELGALQAVNTEAEQEDAALRTRLAEKQVGKAAAVEAEVAGGGYWRTLSDTLQDESFDDKLKTAKGNENHPIYSPTTMEVSMTDRVVFIGMTFALRSFSLTFLEWAMTNRMVNRTETAIVFYVSMYLLMFALWVIIVNVGKRDLFFKVAFYFVNTQGPRGFINIVIHVLMQLLLLPIPFVLQSINSGGGQSSGFMSFEERRRTQRLVGNLSFLMWMVSSLVALRA